MSRLVIFDTNVMVSYLLPSKKVSAVKIAVGQMTRGIVIPVFSSATMLEYEDVLNRKKFQFPADEVHTLLGLVLKNGLYVMPRPTSVTFTDLSDKCFYDAARAARDCWLITGNKRHFPIEPFIVTAAEYLQLTGGVL